LWSQNGYAGSRRDEPSHLRREGPAPPLAEAGFKVADAVAAEKPGDRIGPYRLLEQLGEGGYGVVYVAEQTEPIRRRVALNVIRLVF